MPLDREDAVIDLLYEAALEPAMWSAALEKLGDAVGRSSVAVLTSYHPINGAHLLGSVRYDPENRTRVQLEHATPETNRYIDILNSARSGEVLWPRAFLTNQEWQDDPITRKFLKPDGLQDGLTVPFLLDGSAFLAIGLFRSGFYLPEDIDVFRSYTSDIRRALQVSQHLGYLSDLRNATLEVLDRIYSAVFLVDADVRVKHVNAAGQMVLDRADGIAVGREGRLVVSDRTGAATLMCLITGAGITATRGHRRWSSSSVQSAAGGTMALNRPSGLRPYSLLVAPLRASTFAGVNATRRSASSIIFLADPDRPYPVEGADIENAYGLTAAEARLVAHLIAGHDLHRAARLMGISINSAKTLLQRSFDCTQTRRQSDLINLVLRGPLGVARGDHS
jgi:DNA-binding CsgD family transcriptional regulator